VAALTNQFDQAMAEFRKRYEAAETDSAHLLLMPFYPDPNTYAALFVHSPRSTREIQLQSIP
jgi:hypothetical protein